MKNFTPKNMCLFMAALVCFLLCACGSKTNAAGGNAEAGRDFHESGEEGALSSPGTGSAVSSLSGGEGSETSYGDGDLRLLSNPYGESACCTENGYYYLPFETVELKDGNYGTHLMYMDFATGREIYLCSTAGCRHDTLDCPAVFSYDDFPLSSTLLFVFGDNLYFLSREYDNDGSVSEDVISFSGSGSMAETRPAALYRANPDGTQREKIYTFDGMLTIEDKVFGNDKGIYLITKKLSSDKDGNQTYTVSSERKLMFLDLESLSFNEVCPMDFGDHISWQFTGCCRDGFLLRGTDFGREISRDEKWDDDVYKELYENSFEIYALLGRDGGKPKEITKLSNRYENSVQLLGDSLYLSSGENRNIEEISIKTGEKKTLCTLPQNLIMDVLGDTLCCRDWNLAGDPTWYFVDTKTGALTRTPMVILRNGWSLDFRGETAEDVLFIYDYDATDYNDGSYEIHQSKYALIHKEDLFAGKDTYRKIEMIGPGH